MKLAIDTVIFIALLALVGTAGISAWKVGEHVQVLSHVALTALLLLQASEIHGLRKHVALQQEAVEQATRNSAKATELLQKLLNPATPKEPT